MIVPLVRYQLNFLDALGANSCGDENFHTLKLLFFGREKRALMRMHKPPMKNIQIELSQILKVLLSQGIQFIQRPTYIYIDKLSVPVKIFRYIHRYC